jgi:hypothetical protein
MATCQTPSELFHPYWDPTFELRTGRFDPNIENGSFLDEKEKEWRQVEPAGEEEAGEEEEIGEDDVEDDDDQDEDDSTMNDVYPFISGEIIKNVARCDAGPEERRYKGQAAIIESFCSSETISSMEMSEAMESQSGGRRKGNPVAFIYDQQSSADASLLSVTAGRPTRAWSELKYFNTHADFRKHLRAKVSCDQCSGVIEPGLTQTSATKTGHRVSCRGRSLVQI